MKTIVVFLILIISPLALAHELTPALLALTERAPHEYEVLWRVPRDEAPRGLIAPVLPEDAVPIEAKVVSNDSQASYTKWVVQIAGGLGGRELRLQGPPSARTDALVRIALRDGRVLHGRLAPDGTVFVVPNSPTWLTIATTYVRLGIEHILLGFDHLLFVLGLLLLARDGRTLVKTITAFTAAHSVTLVLATLGVLHVPGPPVEATIALSIVFVAREALATPGQSWGQQRPWLIALPFGLLHGLGFAGALAALGLPPREVPLALAAFNIGVEIGQLAFVGLLSLPGLLMVRRGWRQPRWTTAALAYGIGVIAAALSLGRIVAFRS